MGGAKLTASSLRDQALRVIRARIISGELAPGRLYALGAVAEQLGVSVTPVREAVLDLAREGLVELARNRGFRVREMTERDLDEIVELRRMIEVAAVRTIAERGLLADADRLREIAAATEKCAADGDWVGFLDHDRDLHMGLLAHLGNERLLKIVGSLRDQGRLYGLDRVAGSASLMESTHEHDALIDAVAAGEADLAAAIMDRHLRHTRGIWAGHAEQSG
ncbi:GntR family transcriptional regulator [Jiangella anatolica]|uniref:GntR family transcriptional regulator n=1 Tax=Jiangella anatolica TaxID=2670374 RepID=A0A2W2BFJ0_9ACTN|nr:GntR family transcriptional regulator [Jiangella anatolica]